MGITKCDDKSDKYFGFYARCWALEISIPLFKILSVTFSASAHYIYNHLKTKFMKPQHVLLGLGLALTTACNPSIQNVDHVEHTEVIPDVHDWSSIIPSTIDRTQKFRVTCSKESFITTKTGSQLTIPKHCFVDASGKVIEGEVDLIWEEYHSLADQLLSDINMMYDSAGVSLPFISGGMFKINGSHQGNPIFFAEDKTIRVDLMSQSERGNFNFYQQEPNSTQWTYKQNATFGPRADFEPVKKPADLAKESPLRKGRAGFVLDAKPKNLKDFPELETDEILGWLTPEAPQPKDVFKLTSNKTTCLLEPFSTNNYTLVFQFEAEEVRYPVRAFTIADALKETADEKAALATEKALTAKRQEEAIQREIIRTAEISSFATYNWDVCGRMKNPNDFYANFVHGINDLKLEDYNFALVNLTEKYQVKFDVRRGGAIHKFDAASRNTVIAIHNDGRIFFVEPKEFANFSKNGMTKDDSFELVDTQVTLKSVKDLDQILKTLNEV